MGEVESAGAEGSEKRSQQAGKSGGCFSSTSLRIQTKPKQKKRLKVTHPAFSFSSFPS